MALPCVGESSAPLPRLSADENALRCLLRWPKLQRLELDECSYANQPHEYEDGSDFTPLLAQLSPTSLPALKVLNLSIDTPARLLILERILSFRQITHLDLICDLRSADEMDRVKSAITGIAGQLKSIGCFYVRFPTGQYFLALYPLLVRCEELSLVFDFPSGTPVPLPQPTQLLSLRNLVIYNVTQVHVDLLATFVLERKTPLEILEVHGRLEDIDDLSEVCERVGTKLVQL